MDDYPSSESFKLVAAHYDHLMRDVPYKAWVRYLHELLAARRHAPKRVLDLACGTGTVSELLHREGFDVTGVDLSADMISEARRKAAKRGLAIAYHVQDAAELDLPPPPFDLCVSLFDSLNYMLEPARLAEAIRRVHEHLRPGGLFIFDINSAYALENNFFEQSNVTTNDRLRYVWRSEYDAPTRLCTVSMRFFVRGPRGVDEEFRETHVQFAYTETELRAMLQDAGFTSVETFQAYTRRPTRPTTDRIFFVAERPVALDVGA
jgi:SAM-dependent methyltransferase